MAIVSGPNTVSLFVTGNATRHLPCNRLACTCNGLSLYCKLPPPTVVRYATYYLPRYLHRREQRLADRASYNAIDVYDVN
jgi:hypothetical protein